eukprot:TRINITY_DN18403_c0_g2_i1.p1 TRINITY_DN18403_c0_g2~~TRINITY_DN18403_c0_g2_i1.p1  ORF type:complete len:1019 (-),score=190.60 TRINITY_DN18403_c0_g2_i1:155-3211(-)
MESAGNAAEQHQREEEEEEEAAAAAAEEEEEKNEEKGEVKARESAHGVHRFQDAAKATQAVVHSNFAMFGQMHHMRVRDAPQRLWVSSPTSEIHLAGIYELVPGESFHSCPVWSKTTKQHLLFYGHDHRWCIAEEPTSKTQLDPALAGAGVAGLAAARVGIRCEYDLGGLMPHEVPERWQVSTGVDVWSFDTDIHVSNEPPLAPSRLHVVSPNGEQQCGGTYTLAQSEGGMHVWQKETEPKQWIYQGTDLHWFVGNAAQYGGGDDRCMRVGAIRWGNASGSFMPDLGAKGQRQFGYTGEWSDDADICISIEEPPMPTMLFITSDNELQQALGRYELAGSANGFPMWKHSAEEFYLYSGTDGRWYVHDIKALHIGFQCTSGVLKYSQPHGGVPPDRLHGGVWLIGFSRKWIPDPTISAGLEERARLLVGEAQRFDDACTKISSILRDHVVAQLDKVGEMSAALQAERKKTNWLRAGNQALLVGQSEAMEKDNEAHAKQLELQRKQFTEELESLEDRFQSERRMRAELAEANFVLWNQHQTLSTQHRDLSTMHHSLSEKHAFREKEFEQLERRLAERTQDTQSEIAQSEQANDDVALEQTESASTERPMTQSEELPVREEQQREEENERMASEEERRTSELNESNVANESNIANESNDSDDGISDDEPVDDTEVISSEPIESERHVENDTVLARPQENTEHLQNKAESREHMNEEREEETHERAHASKALDNEAEPPKQDGISSDTVANKDEAKNGISKPVLTVLADEKEHAVPKAGVAALMSKSLSGSSFGGTLSEPRANALEDAPQVLGTSFHQVVLAAKGRSSGQQASASSVGSIDPKSSGLEFVNISTMNEEIRTLVHENEELRVELLDAQLSPRGSCEGIGFGLDGGPAHHAVSALQNEAHQRERTYLRQCLRRAHDTVEEVTRHSTSKVTAMTEEIQSLRSQLAAAEARLTSASTIRGYGTASFAAAPVATSISAEAPRIRELHQLPAQSATQDLLSRLDGFHADLQSKLMGSS